MVRRRIEEGTAMISIGDQSPYFTLKDQLGN